MILISKMEQDKSDNFKTESRSVLSYLDKQVGQFVRIINKIR